jgi:predicted  nucleic acid-binding Zn-ribbon protein
MPDLNYRILTAYEAAGVEQAMQGFEKQRGVAKALGQDYSELDSKIKQLNTALEESKHGQEKAAAEAKDLAKEMGIVTVSHEDLEKATKKTGEAVGESTGAFGKARREIREVGSELGNAIGITRLGGLALGGVAAAAFAAGKAVEFLKDTWDEI